MRFYIGHNFQYHNAENALSMAGMCTGGAIADALGNTTNLIVIIVDSVLVTNSQLAPLGESVSRWGGCKSAKILDLNATTLRHLAGVASLHRSLDMILRCQTRQAML